MRLRDISSSAVPRCQKLELGFDSSGGPPCARKEAKTGQVFALSQESKLHRFTNEVCPYVASRQLLRDIRKHKRYEDEHTGGGDGDGSDGDPQWCPWK